MQHQPGSERYREELEKRRYELYHPKTYAPPPEEKTREYKKRMTKDEEYAEFVKTSASETFKLIIFLILLGLGLVFWPLLIVAFISGGFFFGGERFLK